MTTEGSEILEQAERLSPDEEEENWLDDFSLNHAPPLDSYVIKVKFVDGGRGQPRRYDFGDLFDKVEGGEE
ncbi:MAG: hypothetical protein MOB07_26570 [Acidobacteria bacterium]|nr:hypothetical protein [Acidobacteriota bacterium]